MSRQPTLLYSVADVRAMDAVAINELGIDSYLLMTRAARAGANVVQDRFPTARRLLVVCGAGNNAGDGYLLARIAKDRGFDVTVCSLIDTRNLTGDAQRACQEYLDSGGQCTAFTEICPGDFDVTVDALLGTGLSRPVEGAFAATIERINHRANAVVSLDIPSGLHGDSGHALPVAVSADFTVTFVGRKTGLFTGEGPAYSGQVVYDSLEIPARVSTAFKAAARLLSDADAALALPPRDANAHKAQCGRVLLVAGGAGMPGAAVLAGSAALRAGAGLIKVACHPGNEMAIAMRPELMCQSVAESDMLMPLLEWCDIVAIGPGLGRDDWAEQMVSRCVGAGKPMVADADALYFLPQFSQRPPQLIITPHVGEAARLLDVTTASIQDDRFAACRRISTKYNAVCVLKGAGTVVCTKDSMLSVCDRGNPGMATAGTGDVLTGIVAGVYAQQPDETEALAAARAAVWVHAMAGDRASDRGERGLIASDLLESIRAFVN
ncbi:MAG: NAD(P)H-hydrate dehydratase [Gammaproteobacteria bacterium]|nr:NAD(P)H-hydrate dehydratase [Gammaproteobacteria bacterium]